MLRTIAFWTAVIGSVGLVLLIVVGAAAWPGYSHVRDFISELGATGAPQGRLVSLGGFLAVGVCLTAFCAAAALVAPRSRLRYAGFACLGLFGLGYMAIAFFRCDFGCPPTSPSLSQTLHSLTSLAGYVGAPVGMVLLGLSARRWPGAAGLFPLGLVTAAIAAAGFLGMLVESPVGGLVQRLVEGSILVWIVACAFAIRREPATA
ncbi:MAG: DUF998 domain-containing protein [Caulobacter sp.]|nr:DUF998 domain-containing protein [Caulobacter sp.]